MGEILLNMLKVYQLNFRLKYVRTIYNIDLDEYVVSNIRIIVVEHILDFGQFWTVLLDSFMDKGLFGHFGLKLIINKLLTK